MTVEERVAYLKRRDARKAARLGPASYNPNDDAGGALTKHIPGATMKLPLAETDEAMKTRLQKKQAERQADARKRGPNRYHIKDEVTATRVTGGIIGPEHQTISKRPKPRRVKLRHPVEAEGETAADPTVVLRRRQPGTRIGPNLIDEETGERSSQPPPSSSENEQRKAAIRLFKRVMRKRHAELERKRTAAAEAAGAAAEAESKIERPTASFHPPIGPDLKRKPLISEKLRQLIAQSKSMPLPPIVLPTAEGHGTRHKPEFQYIVSDNADRARRRIEARATRRERMRADRRRATRAVMTAAAEAAVAARVEAQREMETSKPTVFSGAPPRQKLGLGAHPSDSKHEAEPLEGDRLLLDTSVAARDQAMGKKSRAAHISDAVPTGRGGTNARGLTLEYDVFGNEITSHAARQGKEGDTLILNPNPDAVREVSTGKLAHTFARADADQRHHRSHFAGRGASLSDTEIDDETGVWLTAAHDREGDILALDPDAAKDRLRKHIPAHKFREAVSDDEAATTAAAASVRAKAGRGSAVAGEVEEDGGYEYSVGYDMNQPSLLLNPDRSFAEQRVKGGKFSAVPRFAPPPGTTETRWDPDYFEQKLDLDPVSAEEAVRKRPGVGVTDFGKFSSRHDGNTLFRFVVV